MAGVREYTWSWAELEETWPEMLAGDLIKIFHSHNISWEVDAFGLSVGYKDLSEAELLLRIDGWIAEVKRKHKAGRSSVSCRTGVR